MVHESSSADTDIDPTFWCDCVEGPDDVFYAPDGWCKCGERKHHYHCQQCFGIAQIG